MANIVTPSNLKMEGGDNTPSFGPELTGLFHFENSLLSTRGTVATFTRNSVANDAYNFKLIGSGTARFDSGKYGQGIFIEEGTTNLVQNSDFETVTTTTQVFADDMTTGDAWTTQTGSVSYRPSGTTNLVLNSDFETVTGTAQVFSDDMTALDAWTTQSGSFTNTPAVTNLVQNSDFETVTGTATVFSDPLTSYSGTTVPAPWVNQGSGAWTFGSSGATVDTSGALISAGNASWSPLVGSDNSTNLILSTQATFLTPSTMPASSTTSLMQLNLFQSGNSRYGAQITDDGNFHIFIVVSGTYTSLATIAQTVSTSTSYTMTLSLDPSGNLIAKLYSGTSTTGTLLQTLTATETSINGGFYVGVGGDTGVTISNISVTAPWADVWSIGGDFRNAWSLTTSPANGKFGMSCVGVGAEGWVQNPNTNYASVSSSSVYTVSNYIGTSNMSSNGVNYGVSWYDSTGSWITASRYYLSGTNTTARLSASPTSPSNAGHAVAFIDITGTGTVTFDSIQLETGSTMNNYVRNDSTTGSASVPAGATSGAANSIAVAGNSIAVAGNSAWKPLSGSGGQNLALTAQATFTTSPNWTSTSTIDLTLSQDGTSIGSANSDFYMVQTAYSGGLNTITLAKHVNTGTWTSLSSVSQALLPSTDYTITLSLDKNGLLSANLYQGTSATGTPLQSLSATDTSLTGGFLVGVGGDSGVIVSGVSVDAPVSDTWAHAYRVAYGGGSVAWDCSYDSSQSVNGSGSISLKNYNSVSWGQYLQQTLNLSIQDGQTYTWSLWAKAESAVSISPFIGTTGSSNMFATSSINLTTSWQRFTGTGVAPTGADAAGVNLHIPIPNGVRIYFDSIQVEQGSTATQYIRNDSTTTTASAPAGTLSTSNGTFITGGNPNWKPLLGSDGTTKLALTAQATITTPPSITSGMNLYTELYQDTNNEYQVFLQESTFGVWKTQSGAGTQLAGASVSPQPSTTYTMTLSLDNTGLLTANLYSGSSATGTPLQTLTATDTSLTGGFLCGVGGDNGVIISNVSVNAPWANGWTIGYRGSGTYALTKDSVNGNYAINLSASTSAESQVQFTWDGTLSRSTVYTASMYLKSPNMVSNNFDVSFYGGATWTDNWFAPTTDWERKQFTFTTDSTGAAGYLHLTVRDGQSVNIDCVQLEQKGYATSYLRNDSTTSSITRANETLVIPSSVVDSNAGSISVWVNPRLINTTDLQAVVDMAGTGNYGAMLYLTNGLLDWQYYTGSSLIQIKSSSAISANTWNHIVITWGTSGGALYVNGDLAASNSNSANFNVYASGIQVGSEGGASRWFNGIIDELSFFDRVLTDDEIDNLYKSKQPIIDVYKNGGTTTGATEYTAPSVNHSYKLQYNPQTGGLDIVWS